MTVLTVGATMQASLVILWLTVGASIWIGYVSSLTNEAWALPAEVFLASMSGFMISLEFSSASAGHSLSYGERLGAFVICLLAPCIIWVLDGIAGCYLKKASI